MSFHNIPAEMRQYVAWVCWRYEPNDKGKLTKIPYNPTTAKKASVTNPQDWCSFDHCLHVLQTTNYYSGIGFVLSENDPYTVIDLDDPQDDEDIKRRHAYLYDYFQTYTEMSPSGKGVHIVAYGKVPSGRKRQKIEIYSTARYMTFTGNALKMLPVAAYQKDLELLWQEIGGSDNNKSYTDNHEKLTDDEVLQRCTTSPSQAKFFDLWSGAWQQHFASQSEADLALVNLLAYFSENREQTIRLFHQSELGKRDKAQRGSYLDGLLHKAFDRIAPAIDFTNLIRRRQETSTSPILTAESKDAVVAAVQSSPQPHKILDDLMKPIPLYAPPGLLGELATAFYHAVPRPVYDMAIVGAIGMMAGITGRCYNVSDAGLNQYLMVLAEAGVGKDTMVTGISKIMRVLELRVPSIGNYYKSGNIQSAPALIKMMDSQPSVFALKGEYGHELKKMSNGSSTMIYSDLKAVFLDLYSKSGKHGVLKPLTYSDKAKNTNTIIAPAFTFICESTPEIVFDSVDESLVSDGLLSRFNILNYTGKRPPANKNHTDFEFPEILINRVADLAGYCTRLIHENRFIDVGYKDDALDFLDKVDQTCDAIINSNADNHLKALYVRVHLKTLKLAALIAVCENPYEPIIKLEEALWAYNFVSLCTRDLMKQFEEGRVGDPTAENRQMQILQEALLAYNHINEQTLRTYGSTPVLRDAGIIPYTYIYRKVSNKAAFKKDRTGTKAALARILGVLIDTGEITEISQNFLFKNYNATGRAFTHNTQLTK